MGYIVRYNFLELEQPAYGLIPKLWQTALDYFTNGRKINMATYLSPEKLQQLMKYRMGRIGNTVLGFSAFRGNLTDRGLEDQEIEGWRV